MLPVTAPRNRMKCVLSALLGALCAAVALFSVGCVAPFPEGDPRAVLNPVIVPWWRVSPRPVRSFLHELVVGSPLPPNDLQQLDQVNYFSTKLLMKKAKFREQRIKDCPL